MLLPSIALLLLGSVISIIPSEYCCPYKSVSGVAYQLLEAKVNTTIYGCKDNCIYTKVDGGGKFCFKSGFGRVQCMATINDSCVESYDCKVGYSCHQEVKTCIKGKFEKRN